MNVLASMQLLPPNEDQGASGWTTTYAHNGVKDAGFPFSTLCIYCNSFTV